MKLLQIPTAVLDQRIQEELEANPALEEGENEEELYDNYEKTDDSTNDAEVDDDYEKDDFMETEPIHMDEGGQSDFEEYINQYMDDDTASYRYKADDYNGEAEQNKTIPIAIENTFHDHLEKQIGLLNLKNEDQYKIALQIIGSIDDDGYLRREPSAIIDDLVFSQNLDTNEKEINGILTKIQNFDPPGVGARNLRECLMIQIKFKQRPEVKKAQMKVYKLAELILDKYFEEFSKKHYVRLQRALGLSEMQLKDAIDEILKLNPKPSSGYVDSSQGSSMSGQFIVPDFTVLNRDGELELSLRSTH
jgi:RNA polymerase sigma-54 factor